MEERSNIRMGDYFDHLQYDDDSNDPNLRAVREGFNKQEEDDKRRREIARQLWSGAPVPDITLREVVASGYGDEYLELWEELEDGPLLVGQVEIESPREDLWPLDPAGPYTVTFDPPVELRLTIDPGEGHGPWLAGYENPDDPLSIGVTDTNGEFGVSGGTREDLVGAIAEHWGFHFLTTLSEAQGEARIDSNGARIHEDDMEHARHRFTERLRRRVKTISPKPNGLQNGL